MAACVTLSVLLDCSYRMFAINCQKVPCLKCTNGTAELSPQFHFLLFIHNPALTNDFVIVAFMCDAFEISNHFAWNKTGLMLQFPTLGSFSDFYFSAWTAVVQPLYSEKLSRSA